MKKEQPLSPIFIGGTGRSGTTILKKVLLQHSQITGLDQELRIIIDPGGALDLMSALTDRWSPFAADRAVHDFKRLIDLCARAVPAHRPLLKCSGRLGVSLSRYAAFHIGESVGLDDYRNCFGRLFTRVIRSVSHGFWAGSPPFHPFSKIYEAGPFEKETLASWIREAFDEMYSSLGDEDTRCWVEDTPYNILHAPEIFTVFPSMTLLHIYRDPRDAATSYKTKTWGGHDIEGAARRIKNILERWRQLKNRLPKEAVLEIPLESFSENPKKYLEKICERSGIAYEPGFETISLNKVNAGRWKQDLSADEAATVSRILSGLAESMGY